MTDHEMRIRLAEAMGWTDLDWQSRPGWIIGQNPGSGMRDHVPDPLVYDTDAAALEVWCVTTRPWCAGLTIVVDARSVEVCVDTYEGDPDAESVVVHQDTEPDPRRRRRLALCRAVAQALEEEGEP
jgi:hypothetical protein